MPVALVLPPLKRYNCEILERPFSLASAQIGDVRGCERVCADAPHNTAAFFAGQGCTGGHAGLDAKGSDDAGRPTSQGEQ
jgi:hypothetical protein